LNNSINDIDEKLLFYNNIEIDGEKNCKFSLSDTRYI